MRRFLAVILAAAAGLLITMPVSADILGASVTGSLLFPSDGTNYYGSAPKTVGSGTEFYYGDPSGNYISADFASDGLTLYEHIEGWQSASPWTQTFTSSAFGSATVSEIGDDFSHGGISFSHVGNQLVFDWDGTGWSFSDRSYDAQYHISVASPAVPEPSSLIALAGALVALGFGIRRKNMTPKV